MITRTAVGAAIASSMALGSAEAATTHVFDLSKTGDASVSATDNSFSLRSDTRTEEGAILTGTFSGRYSSNLTTSGDGTITSGSFRDAESVDRYFNGAGVCRGDNCVSSYGASGEPHTVDGMGGSFGDFIEMAFSVGGSLVDVTLSSLTFGWIGEWRISGSRLGVAGSDGAFELILDTLDAGAALGIGRGDTLAFSGTVKPNIETRRSRGSVNLSNRDLIDSIFGVKAGDGGSWKLLSVTVEYEKSVFPDGDPRVVGDPPPPPPVSPAPVPLPAGVWLLLSGLGGLIWFRRRATM